MTLTLADIIAHACPSSDEDSEGYAEYHIEVHCVRFIVTALVHYDDLLGKYNVDVRDYRTEDC